MLRRARSYGYNVQIKLENIYMSSLTFRNRLGDLVDIPAVAATKVKNEFGAILERATLGGAVAITRHDLPKAVLLSMAEFEWLVQSRSQSLGNLAAEFDGLIARLQTPKARKGLHAAFTASPAVETVLYDFGAVCVTYQIPVEGRNTARSVFPSPS